MIGSLILTAAKLYVALIIIQSIASFFPGLSNYPILRKSEDYTRPLLDFIRKKLPLPETGLDFAPLIAIIGIMMSARFLAFLFG